MVARGSWARGPRATGFTDSEVDDLSHEILPRLTGILVLGVLAQWVAWRVRLPSILLLLVAGIVAGPVTGWLRPTELFGGLFLPLVSLSVAVILYEGGLNLKFRELRNTGRVFLVLTTLGVAVSWVLGTLAGILILRLPVAVAALLGAILVVTGPTVVGPILRHLRLRGKVGALLKWEGIIIDPVGAALAVMVFTVVEAGGFREGFRDAAQNLGLTLLIGVVAGCLAAGVLVLALSRYWVPDSLHNPVSLALMFVAFTVAQLTQEESGLLAVTVMGIAVANQKWVSIRHVVEFKETLTVLLISCLFIVLAAGLRPGDLRGLGWESLGFVVAMIVLVRPVSVLLSTLGSPFTWPERLFLCCMAPRGIVAAAISSVFAAGMVAAGYPNATEIVPVTFLLVFVTVLLYGLIAAPLARRLGLVLANPQGVLFVGADSWARSLAVALKEEGCPVFLIDSDWENIRRSRMSGLPCLYGSALAEQTHEEIDFSGIGKLLAVTSNNEVNSLACLHFAEEFGKQEVYQLPFSAAKEGRHEVVPMSHRGRLLFGPELSHAPLTELMQGQPRVKKTKLTKEFDYGSFRAEHGEAASPLFVLKPNGTVLVCTVKGLPDPRPGDLILSIVREPIVEPSPASSSTSAGPSTPLAETFKGP